MAMSSQPVPGRSTRSKAAAVTHIYNTLAAPSTSFQSPASPASYGAMSGISFSNGGGFSFENQSFQSGNEPSSYGARFYGHGMESPSNALSTSIIMGSPSFASSSAAFCLPPSSLSASFPRRSYAAAVSSVDNPSALTTSLSSMSVQPTPVSASTTKSRVANPTRVSGFITKSVRMTHFESKTYKCCGQTLEGMHALFEHNEDTHPFTDPDSAEETGLLPITPPMPLDFAKQPLPGWSSVDESMPSGHGSWRPSNSYAAPNYPLKLSMARSASKPSPSREHQSLGLPSLRIADVLTSPPDSDSPMTAARAFSSSSTTPPEGSLATPSTSRYPSPDLVAPEPNPPCGAKRTLDRAFNEVVAGRMERLSSAAWVPPRYIAPRSIAPAMLSGPSSASLGFPAITSEGRDSHGSSRSAAGDARLGDPVLAQRSLFNTPKRHPCPNPGCNKVYKQPGGLKYHLSKGQCSYTRADAIESGLSIKDEEERSQPFVCAVGAGCTKRYRQMNGLKYHYLNSGEHGKYGLRLLHNGTHPDPPSAPPPILKDINPASASSSVKKVLNPTSAPAPLQKPINSAAQSTLKRPRPAAPYSIPLGTGIGSVKVAPAKTCSQIPPVQTGRDAVLFTTSDPLDVMERMDS